MIKIKNNENNENNETIVSYDDNDIKVYEQTFKLKALTKRNTPSKKFIKWLIKDESKHLKKTVVELKKADLYSDKIDNISYEVNVGKDEFENKIYDLINEASKYNNNDIKKREIQKQIKKLLQNNKKNSNLTMNTNISALDVKAQDNLLQSSENYLAYVYFFWSPETMNFKIIGLHSVNPLFEFVNVKQTFYLLKPAMITNDTPIYFCFDKIPYSISFDIKDDLISLTNYFISKGTTSDLFYFMEKNKTFIRVYGFNKIPLKIWIDFILFLAFSHMLHYVIQLNIYLGSG